MNYKFAYSVGFHPWEDAEKHPPFVQGITKMFEREERDKIPPFGKALDLGCGSGIWGICLAKRGWQVTSVDLVDKALKRARKRIDRENIDLKLVKDDVTKLISDEIGSGYNLILDSGTFHGLTPGQRVAMGKAVTEVSDIDASLLLLVWDAKYRAFLPGGAHRDEIEMCFPKWNITHIELADTNPPGILRVLKANEHWYRLRRK